MMNFAKLKFEQLHFHVDRLPSEYLAILAAGYAAAELLSESLWQSNWLLLHAILELTCIFISMCSFMLVWYTYGLTTPQIHFLGYGFMWTVVFDAFHTYFAYVGTQSPQFYMELVPKYWLLGRITEALIILLVTHFAMNIKVNRWAGFSAMFALSTACALFVRYGPTPLVTDSASLGNTTFKYVCEYSVVLMLALSLHRIRNRINDRGILTYRHIFMALLLAIPSHLSFSVFSPTGETYIFGHLLKTVYTYYLFKGIFISSIRYPYEKLNEEKVHRKEILNSLPLGLITFDEGLKASFVNKKAEELMDCTESDILGQTAENLKNIFTISDEDWGGICRLCDSRIPARAGIIKCVSLNKNRISVSYSSFKIEQGYLVLFNNAKEEQELKNLRLQTQTILNSLSNYVIMVDRNGKIILCNKAFSEALGSDSLQIAGMGLRRLLRRLKAGITSKKDWEASFVNFSGITKHVFFRSSPIKNVDSEIIGYIIVATDITSLKEERVKSQEQEKLALVGQLGSSIVHETKNLLASMKGYCQLITMKTPDEGIKVYSGRINDIIEEMNNVVSGFLSFARPSDPDLKNISLNEMIESVRYIIESPSFIKNIRVTFSLTQNEKKVMADQSQLRQVVINMTKNAIEALSDTATPVISIGTRYSEAAGEMQLIISDNGKGMPEEVVSRLGTPFFTTKDTGTGLGLSLCYRVISAHNGKIEVRSRPGRGTTFMVSLPLGH